MYKIIFLITLFMLSGCKDKYERALEEVTKTSIPVRKCELKKLAQEIPNFSCGQIEHQIAIETAKSYDIKDERILAATNLGRLQADQNSVLLIRKAAYLRKSSEYQENHNANLNQISFLRASFEDIKKGNIRTLYTIPIVPKECYKLKQEKEYSSGGFRSFEKKNPEYDFQKCSLEVNKLISEHEKYSKIWAKKAEEQKTIAMRINTEY